MKPNDASDLAKAQYQTLSDLERHLKVLDSVADTFKHALQKIHGCISEPGMIGDGSQHLHNSVFVTRLVSGNYFPCKPYCRAAALRLLKMADYDYVVDECERRFILRKDGDIVTLPFRSLRGMQSGMLWLIQTCIYPNGYIEHDDIKRLFGFPNIREESRIYLYRNHLRTLLGNNLVDKILACSVDKRYDIYKHGWSFCWICKDKDTSRSELLKRVKTRCG